MLLPVKGGIMSLLDRPISNLVLLSLRPDDLAILGPFAMVDLELRQVLQGANDPMKFVYFPEGALVSVVANAPGRKDIEVGIVGIDGMTGLALAQGDMQSPFESFVQVAGAARRIGADHLLASVKRSPTLKALLLLHGRAFELQVASTTVANGRYRLEERLARWLVMVGDRVGDSFAITHEFLGLMLGVRRSGVTVALQILVERGLIRVSRGNIVILDRPSLIKATQGSYGMAEREGERLVG